MPNPMTAAQVAEKLRELRADYVAENGWFRFYVDGNEPMNPDKFADAAGRAYEHVKSATVPLLLGDTKLRSDAALVANFGVSDGESASASAASSSSAARSSSSGIVVAGNLTRAGSSATAARDEEPSGGILDNNKWSPMLNDAFIMGGIHNHKQFVFTPVDGDLAFVKSIMPSGHGADPKQQHINAAIPAWRAFFQTRQYLLWDRNYPRVLVRELLGLEHFGYQAQPTTVDLSFQVGDVAAADTATFKEYCKYLKDSGYRDRKRKDVMQILARFLFGAGNESALDNVGGP